MQGTHINVLTSLLLKNNFWFILVNLYTPTILAHKSFYWRSYVTCRSTLPILIFTGFGHSGRVILSGINTSLPLPVEQKWNICTFTERKLLKDINSTHMTYSWFISSLKSFNKYHWLNSINEWMIRVSVPERKQRPYVKLLGFHFVKLSVGSSNLVQNLDLNHIQIVRL